MRKPLFVLRKRSRLFLGVVVFLFLMSFFVAQHSVHAVAATVVDGPHTAATVKQTFLDEKERVKKEVKMKPKLLTDNLLLFLIMNESSSFSLNKWISLNSGSFFY